MSAPDVACRIHEEMVHPGLVALIVLAGCRIGFDPIGASGPDAGTEPDTGTDPTAVGACDPGTACRIHASQGSIVAVTCAPGQDCLVECSLASTCAVSCNDAASCIVNCPAAGCAVRQCDARCDVLCGEASLPSHQGGTATCP